MFQVLASQIWAKSHITKYIPSFKSSPIFERLLNMEYLSSFSLSVIPVSAVLKSCFNLDSARWTSLFQIWTVTRQSCILAVLITGVVPFLQFRIPSKFDNWFPNEIANITRKYCLNRRTYKITSNLTHTYDHWCKKLNAWWTFIVAPIMDDTGHFTMSTNSTYL